jgi:transcriptional regulator with XRE-family HTH domain
MSGLGQEDRWVEKDWTLSERFAANVVWFRRKAGLSQQQLADRVGMKRPVLSALERGLRVPRLDTILKLVAGLEVRNCDLVAWMWWDPARHEHYETPPSIADISGYEVLDFDLPAGFRVSPSATRARSGSRTGFGKGVRKTGRSSNCCGTMPQGSLPASDRMRPGCCAPGRRLRRFARSGG